MKNAHVVLIACLSAISANTSATGNHCSPGEEVYFNCPIKGSNKVASLCGAGFDQLNNIPGYIQYRFGKLGDPEFLYPRTLNPNDQKNLFYSWAGIAADGSFSDSEFVFKNESWMYKLNYREEKIKGKTVTESSIDIWQGKVGKQMRNHRTLQCSNSEGNDEINLVFKLRLLNSPNFKFDEF